MAAEVQIIAKFTEIDSSFIATFGETTAILPDPYPGPYEVVPKVTAQVLSTRHKSMADDVTIEEVPYTEVSNISGTTVIIATD